MIFVDKCIKFNYAIDIRNFNYLANMNFCYKLQLMIVLSHNRNH